MTVVCLGEALVDLICPEPAASLTEARSFEPRPGGAMANVALAVARAGGSAALAGGVGDDAWGRWLHDRLEEHGVDLRFHGLLADVRTPLALVVVDERGDADYEFYGGSLDSGLRSLEATVEGAVEAAAALAVGSNTLSGEPGRTITRRARDRAIERGVPVCLDPNLRPGRWADLTAWAEECRAMLEGAELVKANLAEAESLTGRRDPVEAAEGLLALGARTAVVTLGREGALARGAASAEVPGIDVEVVSTVGAGDAAFGALLARLSGARFDPVALPGALSAAVEAGAEACTRLGAQP